MKKHSIKDRCFTRVFFKDSDNIIGIMSPIDDLDKEKLFSLSILNMSEGGIQIRQKRREYKDVQQGETMNLCQIVGLEELASLADITMKIMWVMDNEYLDHVIMGVAFLDLSDSQCQALQLFVKKHLTRFQE